MDKLKLEKAVTLLTEGVRRFPTDTPILDLYADLLIQLGEHDKAKKVSPVRAADSAASSSKRVLSCSHCKTVKSTWIWPRWQMEWTRLICTAKLLRSSSLIRIAMSIFKISSKFSLSENRGALLLPV